MLISEEKNNNDVVREIKEYIENYNGNNTINTVTNIYNTNDKYDKLEKIKRLLEQGILTKEEFEVEKTKILQSK